MKTQLFFLVTFFVSLSNGQDDKDPVVTGPTRGTDLDPQFNVKMDEIFKQALYDVDKELEVDPFAIDHLKVTFTQPFSGRKIPVTVDYKDIRIIGLKNLHGVGSITLFKTKSQNIVMNMSLVCEEVDMEANGFTSALGVGDQIWAEARLRDNVIPVRLYFHPGSPVSVQDIRYRNSGLQLLVTEPMVVDVDSLRNASHKSFDSLMSETVVQVAKTILTNLSLKPLEEVFKKYIHLEE